MNILVINGPNLNMLGIREPDIYGKETYNGLVKKIEAYAEEKGVAVTCYQSNHEGDLIDNIQFAYGVFDGIVINPGETFSYWRTIGEATEKKGYKQGLVVMKNGLSSGFGGGLCQMANMIHWLVLNSPLDVTELHHHSDALFPDERRRVPFGTGTSVYYNNVDYRFKNNTDQKVQILVWVEEGELCGELRSEKAYPYRYKLVEENNHFRKEGDDYYRISQVYRLVIDRKTNEQVRKELILDNHSKVMYDHSLIPADQIREEREDADKNTEQVTAG